MAVAIEIKDSDGTETLILARDWIQMIWKIKRYLQNREISYPLGEDDDMATVTKKIKEVPKFS